MSLKKLHLNQKLEQVSGVILAGYLTTVFGKIVICRLNWFISWHRARPLSTQSTQIFSIVEALGSLRLACFIHFRFGMACLGWLSCWSTQLMIRVEVDEFVGKSYSFGILTNLYNKPVTLTAKQSQSIMLQPPCLTSAAVFIAMKALSLLVQTYALFLRPIR